MNPQGTFISLKVAGLEMLKDDLQRSGTKALKMTLLWGQTIPRHICGNVSIPRNKWEEKIVKNLDF